MDWLAFSLVSNLVRKHILNLVILYLFGLTQTKQTTIQWCPQKKSSDNHMSLFLCLIFCGTSSNFISVQLWLGGKVGLENFSITPMLRDPPYLFSHPTQGGLKTGHACKSPDNSVGITSKLKNLWPTHLLVCEIASLLWPPTSQFKECAKRKSSIKEIYQRSDYEPY